MCIGTQAMNIINNYKKKGGREERERRNYYYYKWREKGSKITLTVTLYTTRRTV